MRGGAAQNCPRSAWSPDPMEVAGCSYQFRIALLGDAAVGKTSLLRRYVAGARGAVEPEPEPEPTVGVEFYSRALQLPAGLRVKLQLWDTAGHERFRCGGKGNQYHSPGDTHACRCQPQDSSRDLWTLPSPLSLLSLAFYKLRGMCQAPQPQQVLSLRHTHPPPTPAFPKPLPNPKGNVSLGNLL